MDLFVKLPADNIPFSKGLFDFICFNPGEATSPITFTEIDAGDKLEFEINSFSLISEASAFKTRILSPLKIKGFIKFKPVFNGVK